MGLLEMVMGLASSQSNKIAQVLGRSPQEVKKALEQGKKLLPDIINSKDGGVSILKDMGVNKRFIDEMYNRYGGLASKVGLDKNVVQNTIKALEKSMNESPTAAPKKAAGFNSKKYPKV